MWEKVEMPPLNTRQSQEWQPGRRAYLAIFGLALLVGTLLAAALDQPGYTDAYYYFNAGQRLAQGQGLTDAGFWTYINAPETLPGPSHTYWMPLESLVAAASMALGGATFAAAQVPSVLCFAALVTLAFWIGASQGRSRRHAWGAGLLVLFSGLFVPFWTSTDTFALYGLVGALALVATGRGRETGDWRWYAFGGAMSGLAHLTRADGVLFLVVLVLVALWPRSGVERAHRLKAVIAGVAVYLLVMLPWLARSLSVMGTPLPSGGMQTIWLRGYNELVSYPPSASLSHFINWGWQNIFQSRWTALANNLGTFTAVETWVILGPFVLIGLWNRRRSPFLLGVILYAVGLHLAMTFVFAYPGYRGGLFHSSSSLLPFWATAGLLGLDDGIDWMAVRRRWRAGEAQLVFSSALIIMAALLSLGIALKRIPVMNDNAKFYRTLTADLPRDAVLMVNDPAALYYHTGHLGVVLPDSSPDRVPEIAVRYGVTHMALDVNRTQPFTDLLLGKETRPFLHLLEIYDNGTPDPSDDRRVFEIIPPERSQ